MENKKEWKKDTGQPDIQKVLDAQAQQFAAEEMKLRLQFPESLNSLLKLKKEFFDEEMRLKETLRTITSAGALDPAHVSAFNELKGQLETLFQQQDGLEKEIVSIVNADDALHNLYFEYVRQQSVHATLRSQQQANYHLKK